MNMQIAPDVPAGFDPIDTIARIWRESDVEDIASAPGVTLETTDSMIWIGLRNDPAALVLTGEFENNRDFDALDGVVKNLHIALHGAVVATQPLDNVPLETMAEILEAAVYDNDPKAISALLTGRGARNFEQDADDEDRGRDRDRDRDDEYDDENDEDASRDGRDEVPVVRFFGDQPKNFDLFEEFAELWELTDVDDISEAPGLSIDASADEVRVTVDATGHSLTFIGAFHNVRDPEELYGEVDGVEFARNGEKIAVFRDIEVEFDALIDALDAAILDGDLRRLDRIVDGALGEEGYADEERGRDDRDRRDEDYDDEEHDREDDDDDYDDLDLADIEPGRLKTFNATPEDFDVADAFRSLWRKTDSDDLEDVPGLRIDANAKKIEIREVASGNAIVFFGAFENHADIEEIDGTVERILFSLDGKRVAVLDDLDIDLHHLIDAMDEAVFERNPEFIDALFGETDDDEDAGDRNDGGDDDDDRRGDRGRDDDEHDDEDRDDDADADDGAGGGRNADGRDRVPEDFDGRVENGDAFDFSGDDADGGVQVNLGKGRAVDGDGDVARIGDILDVTGSDQDDQIVGSRGDNVLDGAGGDDALRGKGGDDDLDGGAGDDALAGGGGDDGLDGGRGDDHLRGQGGADTLDGGAGDDVLNGGGGADVFVYSAEGFGEDQLLRFQHGVDQVEIDASLADAFSALSIEEIGRDVVVSFGGGAIAFVKRDVEDVTADDFLFVG